MSLLLNIKSNISIVDFKRVISYLNTCILRSYTPLSLFVNIKLNLRGSDLFKDNENTRSNFRACSKLKQQQQQQQQKEIERCQKLS